MCLSCEEHVFQKLWYLEPQAYDSSGLVQDALDKFMYQAVVLPGLKSIVKRQPYGVNQNIVVRDWYEPVARKWLEMQARHLQQVRLIVDGTTWFCPSVVDSQSGVSEKSDPYCLDLGQAHSGPQLAASPTGIVGVC